MDDTTARVQNMRSLAHIVRLGLEQLHAQLGTTDDLEVHADALHQLFIGDVDGEGSILEDVVDVLHAIADQVASIDRRGTKAAANLRTAAADITHIAGPRIQSALERLNPYYYGPPAPQPEDRETSSAA